MGVVELPQLPASRVLGLPRPRTALVGGVEVCGWVLLHRAAPFDFVSHLRWAAEWGLTVSAVRSPFVGASMDGPAGVVGVEGRGRAVVLGRLRLLAEGCPPPVVLARAVRLAWDAPWLTEVGLRRALLLAGVSKGQAGAALLRVLSELWGMEVAGSALWPDALGEQRLGELASRVRRAGVLAAPEPAAGEARWLRERRRVVWSHDFLAAAGDVRSGFGRAVRRQLAAVGPLDPAVVGEGAARDGPHVVSSGAGAVLAWVCAQPDLHLRDGLVTPVGETVGWLLESDRPVLQLAPDAGGELQRVDVLDALQRQGMTRGSAAVWLSHCPWLRSAGRRGRYCRAG